MSFLLVAAAVAGPAAAQPAPTAAGHAPWVEMTRQDLRFIRDTLSQSHPAGAEANNAQLNQQVTSGLTAAEADAASVASYFDYRRALRRYVNGFNDGHVGLSFLLSAPSFWPGFAVAKGADGQVVVARAEEDAGVASGQRLVSCDGKTVDQLLTERIDPYYWNREIPHERDFLLGRLFVADNAAEITRTCRFQGSAGETEVQLKWRPAEPALAEELRSGRDPEAKFELRQVAGIWLVRLPTFTRHTAEEVAEIRELIDELKNRAPELRQGIVVLDVRGNWGGNSSWGDEIVDVLWGPGWTQYVRSRFDSTTDWRVSQANIGAVEANSRTLRAAGQEAAAASNDRLREDLTRALAQGQATVRREARPQPIGRTPPNLITGRVFLLTDPVCASACLDLADVVTRLPNAMHVGFPTSADTIYMENTSLPLPSRLGRFNYPMKAYRNRVRGNNRWYEPAIRWPGGPMTPEAIAQWVRTLPRSPESRRR